MTAAWLEAAGSRATDALGALLVAGVWILGMRLIEAAWRTKR